VTNTGKCVLSYIQLTAKIPVNNCKISITSANSHCWLVGPYMIVNLTMGVASSLKTYIIEKRS